MSIHILHCFWKNNNKKMLGVDRKMGTFLRTDLAIESAEMLQETETLQGVRIHEMTGKETGIHVTRVTIENEIGAKQLGKSKGEYITLDVPKMDQKDEDYHREIAYEIAEQIKVLVPDIRQKRILVAGVGNRQMAPDALGPLVVDHLLITRHLNLPDAFGCVSALAPGVMAQTGMETREILLGAIKETKPDLLIVVDALAARSVNRLNKTIQMTNAGIAPGAGIGNRRSGMNAQSMGIPVIAIGIPTVIDAASIVNDTVGRMLTIHSENNNPLLQMIQEQMGKFDEEERYQLVQELMDFEMLHMFVTPKNMDELMDQMSFTLSEALNMLFHSYNSDGTLVTNHGKGVRQT